MTLERCLPYQATLGTTTSVIYAFRRTYMRHGLNQESWKSLLPEVYSWLATVKVSFSDKVSSGNHQVVAVKTPEKDSKDSFTINAPKFSQDLVKKLTEQATLLGWKPSAGALHLTTENATFTLVAQSSVKASAKQVARQFGIDAAKATKELKLKGISFVEASGLSLLEVLDGYTSGLVSVTGFKGNQKKDKAEPSKLVSEIELLGQGSSEEVRQQLELGRSQALARFLQDAPANYLNPLKFAEIAADLAKDQGLACKVLDKEAMTKLGMGSFLSVADGGSTEPRTIVIEIPGVDNSKTVALVGKGLTFDAGGISIKPSAGMEEMKYDMSGAAAVLGAAHFFGKVKPPVKVVCLIGATENMPSGTATKPGDVVRAMNGKTIEVHNTDAEGRLVLADVLHYAVTEYKPDLTVDIATLTGAVLIALGCVGAGLMSNNAEAASHVLKAGEQSGEPLWQLPLWPELEKETKGDVADLKNIAKGSVKGGTIMGGMFLKEFVGDAKWVHLDIAGTGWNCQALGYPSSGGAAFGLRTLIGTCQNFGK